MNQIKRKSINRKTAKMARNAAIELKELITSIGGPTTTAENTHDTWGLYSLNVRVILSLIDKMSDDLIVEIKRTKEKHAKP